MADRVIRVGIAGQGRSGFDIHARWLRQVPERFRIVAVADELAPRRAQAKKELGCRTYKDYAELAADEDVELFVNATPSHLHPKATLAALRRGKHVVCEKPLAVRVADFDEMTAAARDARRLLAPFQNSRFHPFFRKIQEVVDSGVLGRLVHVRIHASGFARRWDWQTRKDLWGGNLNNTGPHTMDHAVMLFGRKTPKVFARLASLPNSSGDADDFADVTLYGPDAPTVQVIVSSYMAYPPADRYLVNGTCGGLAGGPDALRWRYYNPAAAPRPGLMSGWSDDRNYCREELPWQEESWTAPKLDVSTFEHLSRCFYENLYAALTAGARLIVQPAQVRRQIGVLEEAHRQNRLPKRGSAAWKKNKRP